MLRALIFTVTASTLFAADITGLVVAEHDGAPIVAAAITVRSAGQVVAEFETDESGRFRAPGLPAADYTVEAAKASFGAAERRVSLADQNTDLFLPLTKLGVISGRVIDSQGNGIRNVVVAAAPAPTDGGPVRLLNSRPTGAATDASGRYRIFGLPPGDYIAVALTGNARNIANVPNGIAADTSRGSTAEFYPSTRNPTLLSIRSGEEHTNINFTGYAGPLFSISGNVIGPSPETGYRVALVAEGVHTPLLTAIAQPGQPFKLDRVAPGAYRLVAVRQPPSGSNLIELINTGQILVNAANVDALIRELEAAGAAGSTGADAPVPPPPAFGETTVTVVSQDIANLTLSARPGVDAKLVYQAGDGCPTPVQLVLNPIEYMGLGTTVRRVTAGEEALFTGMPPAPYTVGLNLPESSGCYAATATIDFRAISSGSTVPIVAAPLGRIEGKVDTTGYRAEEFTVALLTPEGVRARTLPLAADSTFSMPNLLPGRYRVSVTRRSATRAIAADQDISVTSGATARLEFPALP